MPEKQSACVIITIQAMLWVFVAAYGVLTVLKATGIFTIAIGAFWAMYALSKGGACLDKLTEGFNE